VTATLRTDERADTHPALPTFATRPVVLVAVAVTALLVGFANRYGYHRDELYFLAAGRHLAWGYPDQPPFVPVMARVLSAIAPGSLMVLRLPSAFAAGAIVVLTGLLAREFGGDRGAQVLAAASMAIAALLLGAGHLLSTTTYDLLSWAILLWLVVRILRTGHDRLWLVVGLVAGVGLLDSDLAAFLLGSVVVGLLLVGPRRPFASPWLWVGGAIAAALWSPYLVWQASHGWPQLDVSRAIAAGRSGTSAPRAVFLPFQLGLVSPFLAPIWIAGLVNLFRDHDLRWARALAWAYVLLALVFVATGGKPYYLGGMFPLLLAAGAPAAVRWLRRGDQARRRLALGAAFVLSSGSIAITLPVVPVASLHSTPIVSFNYDAGETVAWPTFVREIASVYDTVRADDAIVLASNYGEAGAVDHYGQRYGLPHAYSGQTGYWYWGPPPAAARTAVAVGFTRPEITRAFTGCRLAARLDNHLAIDDDEQRAPVWVCTDPVAPWRVLWRRFRTT
jgi:hypothetical protein